MMKKQIYNPYLPLDEYVPDAEPHVFDGRSMYTVPMTGRTERPSVCWKSRFCRFNRTKGDDSMSRHNIDSETMIMNRDQVIIRTSVIGILANVFLAAFKAAVGIASHSIAVILDAVNNLSDALSSIITIIGTKLAGKQPDKKHPLRTWQGRVSQRHDRIRNRPLCRYYLRCGIREKIIHPEKPDYSILSLVIIAVAVAVKIILGRYVRAKGEQVNSGSLVASGSDAMFDAILSASVLASAIIFMVTGISLEALVGRVYLRDHY